MALEEKLFKTARFLYSEAHAFLIRDPDKLLGIGDEQMELGFPFSALRKFQLFLRDSDRGYLSDFVAYCCMSDAYQDLGKHKKALEMRLKVYKECRDHLMADVRDLLLEDHYEIASFLIKSRYDNFRKFWEEIVSHHKATKSLPDYAIYMNDYKFNYRQKLTLKELLQKYIAENPEEATHVLKKIQEDFGEIHPDSETLGPYDLKSYAKEFYNLGESGKKLIKEGLDRLHLLYEKNKNDIGRKIKGK